jgi:hypothetical protein
MFGLRYHCLSHGESLRFSQKLHFGTSTKSPSPQGLFFTWIELGTFHSRIFLYNVIIPMEEKPSYQSGINKLIREWNIIHLIQQLRE